MSIRRGADDTKLSDSASPADPVTNVWNDAHRHARRAPSADRPWYAYAQRLLGDAGLNCGRALDLGCGVGEFIAILEHLGFNASGLDGEPAQVEYVRQRGLEATHGDLESDLPYPTSQFDLVTCLEVVEHLARVEHLLRETWRVLRPSGHLLLSTPNFGIWQNRFRYLLGRPPVNEGIHLRFFTPGRLRDRLEAAGFCVVGRCSFGPVTGWNYMRRMLGKAAVDWLVPGWAESFLAEHLVYLCVKKVVHE